MDGQAKATGPFTFVIDPVYQSFGEDQMPDLGRLLLHHFIEASTTIMPGLTGVHGYFHGSGDSADDSSWTFYRGAYEDDNHFEVDIDKDVESLMTNFMFMFVDSKYGGWENNDGGHGTVVFDLGKRSVVLDMYHYVTSEEHAGETALFDDSQFQAEDEALFGLLADITPADGSVTP